MEMQKIVLQYIYKDPLRASRDTMLNMLYDMTDDRFEACILIPILEKIEEEISPEDDRFLYYFTRIYSAIRITNYSETDAIHPFEIWYLVSSDNNLCYMMFRLIYFHYGVKIYRGQDEHRDFIQNVSKYITDAHSETTIPVSDFIDDNQMIV